MRVFTAGLILAATQASAYEMACTFDQECFEGDACAETNFSFSLDMLVPPVVEELPITGEVATFYAVMTTDAETIEGRFTSPAPFGVAGVFASFSPVVTHTVTITTENTARYVAIFAEDGFLISYSGTCEGLAE